MGTGPQMWGVILVSQLECRNMLCQVSCGFSDHWLFLQIFMCQKINCKGCKNQCTKWWQRMPSSVRTAKVVKAVTFTLWFCVIQVWWLHCNFLHMTLETTQHIVSQLCAHIIYIWHMCVCVCVTIGMCEWVCTSNASVTKNGVKPAIRMILLLVYHIYKPKSQRFSTTTTNACSSSRLTIHFLVTAMHQWPVVVRSLLLVNELGIENCVALVF